MNRRQFHRLALTAALGQALLRGHAQSLASPGGPRFSVMLWTLEKLAPFDRCIEMVAAGYNGVELVGEFQKWPDEERKRVMSRMRSLGLVFDAMSGVKAGFSDPGESEAFMTQFAAQ